MVLPEINTSGVHIILFFDPASGQLQNQQCTRLTSVWGLYDKGFERQERHRERERERPSTQLPAEDH